MRARKRIVLPKSLLRWIRFLALPIVLLLSATPSFAESTIGRPAAAATENSAALRQTALRQTLAQTKVALPIVVERTNLVVRAEAGMEKLARDVADASPKFLEEIRSDLPNLEVPKHIEIRLVHKSSSLPGVAPPGHGAPSWASGVAYSKFGVVSIAHASGTEINNVLSVTAHELSHLALGAALHDRAPRWLNEGFAYLHSSDFSVARMQVLTGMAWSGNTIPLANLDSSFPAAEIEVHKAYAQSYDFVAFLARRGRYVDKEDEGDRWPFRNFLAHISDGKSTDEAARKAFGVSLNQLYGEWYEDLRGRYMMVPASLFGLFVWSFAALLLVIGYIKKTRRAKRILAIWEAEERARSEALVTLPLASSLVTSQIAP